ncbi:MAG: hypothetical protein ABEJ86_02440 [Halococcoides sp.]
MAGNDETTTALAGGVAAIASLAVGASVVLPADLRYGGMGLLALVTLVVGGIVLLSANTIGAIKKEFALVGYSGQRGVEGQSWFVGLYRLAGLASSGCTDSPVSH